MLVTVILALSILLQFSAAGIALWLVRIRTMRWAWILIATAITLMAFRRCITMVRILSGDISSPPDLPTAVIGLIVSSCMVVGLGLLARPRATHPDRSSGDILPGSSDRRLSRTAVGLGALAIVGSCAVAGYSYSATRQARLRDVSTWVQHEARQIAAFVESLEAIKSPQEVVQAIDKQARLVIPRYPGTYLCVLDGSAALALCTRQPDAVGTQMGDSPLAADGAKGPATFGELIGTGQGWVGPHVSLSGERQITALEPISKAGFWVAVHVPQASVDDLIFAEQAPWSIGIAVVALVLFPVSITMLHRSYSSAQHRSAARLVSLQQNQKALRKSESRFRRHFELGAIGMATSSPDKAWLEANDCFCELLGYSRQALLNLTWKDVTHPDDVAQNDILFEEALAGTRDSYVLEKRFIRQNGEVRNVILSVVPVRHETGSVDYFLVLAQDITERKRAEEQSQLTKFAVDCSSQSIYWVRADGGIAYANQAACATLGYSFQELVSMSVPQIDPDFPQELWAQHWEELKRSGSMTFEAHHRRKDGHVFPVEITTNYMDHLGQQYIWAFVRDITERRRVEEDNRRLTTAIDQTADSIVITDPEGTIQYVNPAFERISGYSASEALGRNPRLLASGLHDAEFYRHLWKRICSGRVWSGHFINARKDGTLYEEEATISPVRDASGKIVNFVAVKRDVTRERELEVQLRQSHKMEAVGQLASGVAHDLNNLLTVISTGSQLLRDSVSDNEQAGTWLDSMNQAVAQATEMTRSLMTFGRKLPLRKRHVRLQDEIQAAARMLSHSLPASIELIVAVECDRPIWVNADPTPLQQIILNLAVNARDAMPDGGRLRIHVAAPEVFPEQALASTPSESQRACITVSDTGTGMSAEVRSRIFDPFFTTKPAGQGTGLGLAVVHGIVEDHGGSIRVQSQVGGPTSFSIFLPCVALEESPGTSANGTIAELAGEGIVLLAEDHDQVREIIAAGLNSVGFTVKQVKDGQELLMAANHLFENLRLLVLDVNLPKKDGLDCLRSLRAAGLRAPAIVVTGGDIANLGDLDDGQTVLLPKPFAIGDLQRLACRLVSGSDEATILPVGSQGYD